MIDVEPLIVTELERMLPLPDGGRADWSDVLQRSGRSGGSERWGWRRVVVAAVVTAALVGAGVAIAAGFGAFNGISAAQHPQTPADTLDQEDLPPHCGDSAMAAVTPSCHLILSSARLLRTVPGGAKLWVVTDRQGDLCVVLERGGGSCGTGLTTSQPTTITSSKLNDQTPAISWGVTLDSVASVSFPAGGQEVTVPVTDNVWFYQGDNSGLGSMTVHFKDGSTERPQSDVHSRSGG